jgi:protease I|nr:intracellular protease, PfpI family [Actinomycetes bacterium]
MADELRGMRIAFVATDGVEQVELTEPWSAVQSAGARPLLVSMKPGTIQGFNHLDKADTFTVDLESSKANFDEFDALVLPGGVANPDALRIHPPTVSFIRRFAEVGKPIAVICHGPWTLVEADVVRGRTLTSWPSLKTDIRNAGGEWRDEEVFVCTSGPGTITSSRKPADLPAFNRTLISEFAKISTRS